MNIKIANKLVELRKKNGLSQEELADKLGLSRQAVSKWERAESSPDTDNLICLAKLYNVSLDDLLNTDETLEEISREVKEKEEEKSRIEKETNEKNEAEEKRRKKFNLVEGILSGSLALIMTIIYFVVCFNHPNEWSRLWIIYFGVVIIPSIVKAIKNRRFCQFNYAILVTCAFMGLGFYLDLWHPGWIVFLSIPVFYSVFGPIDNAIAEKRNEKINPEDKDDDDDEDEE